MERIALHKAITRALCSGLMITHHPCLLSILSHQLFTLYITQTYGVSLSAPRVSHF